MGLLLVIVGLFQLAIGFYCGLLFERRKSHGIYCSGFEAARRHWHNEIQAGYKALEMDTEKEDQLT